MENEPVLMGCIGDERDRFSMHVHACMCVKVNVNELQVRVCRYMDLCSYLCFSTMY